MIYRKWSLLTGPAAILGTIVATVVVANYLFVENFIGMATMLEVALGKDPFLKPRPRKETTLPSTK